jgi:hypothetical protein
MRKDVLKELRKQFGIEVSRRCKKFVPVVGYRGSPGSDLFVWDSTDDLKRFVLLLPNPKPYRDSFMVELAWSGATFPEKAPLQSKQRLNAVVDGRIRLPQLWRENWSSALEPWWEAGDSLTVDNTERFYSAEETSRRMKAVGSLACDAAEKIAEYAIPFFERVADARRA